MPIDYEEVNRAQCVSETDTFTAARYRQFARNLPEGCVDVMDVGCNTGRGGRVLLEANPGLVITGLDCVPERLQQLPQGVYQHTLLCSATSIPMPGESFDAVVAGEFIEHLTPRDATDTLVELHRVLRPGGRLLLTTPNPRYLRNVLLGRSVLGGAHLSEFTPEAMVELLLSVGFKRVRVVGTGRVSLVLGTRMPWLPLYGSYMAIADK